MGVSTDPRRWRRRLDDEQGAVAILTAVMLAALVTATSLAVDVGRVAYVSRDLQGATDRAALDAVTALLDPKATWGEVCDAVAAELDRSLARNDASVGVAGADHERSFRIGRIVGGVFVPTIDCGVPTGLNLPPYPTALEVTTANRVDYVFTVNGGGRDLARQATALIELPDDADAPPRRPLPIPGAGDPVAAIEVRSTTATLQDGAVNRVLAAFLGGDVELHLVGWQGVSAARVTFEDLLVALDAGTPEQAAEAAVGVAELLQAAATVLQASGDAVDAAAAANLLAVAGHAAANATLAPVALLDVAHLDTGNRAAFQASIDPYQLMTSSLQVANRERAVELDLAVPGLLGASLTVVEGPRMAVGPAQPADHGGWATSARTSQLELTLELDAVGAVGALAGAVEQELTGLMESLLCPPPVVGGLLPPLPCVASVTTSVLDDTLEVEVRLAPARADLTAIDCDEDRRVTAKVASAAATLGVPARDLVGVQASLLTYSLAGGVVRAGAEVALAETGASTLDLTGPFPTEGQRIGTASPGLHQALTAPGGLEVTSNVSILGTPLPAVSLRTAALDALGPTLQGLDVELAPLLAALGIELGVTEVRALDVLGCEGRWLLRPR